MSEDKKGSVPNMRFETAYHNSTSSLKNDVISVSSMPVVYCWCKKKKNELLLSTTLISNFTHDKNVQLICLKYTCEYSSHKKCKVAQPNNNLSILKVLFLTDLCVLYH